ncbi:MULTISPECIES: Hvo_1808 family surface protein [Salinibaculum]|uniref:Hvo_1808 family surface protein n=1 Tax=Salinibaculum TaxID=2732368 RepID=UPI0030D11D09
MKRVALLTLLVVLAGCAAIGSTGDSGSAATPAGDLGVEAGYSYDDPVSVTVDDGLNASERDAVVARAMARIERMRGLEFTESVNVTVISRAEYREDQPFGTNATHSQWNNQVWEGLFIVGEDRDISDVFNETYGGAVLGYYEPGSGDIVVVSDSETPTVDRDTLVHELVHALQDQRFGLDESPDTQDRQLARNGVVEGEASIIEDRYRANCGESWDCIESVPTSVAGGGVDRGLLDVVLYPYVVGPTFVETVQNDSGWEAIDSLHEDYPASTEQVTRPSLFPGEKPVNVSVADRSNPEWDRFDHDPVADTVGQASLYVMFADNGVIASGSGRYQHPATDGWAGDALVPYRNGDQYGYVWELAWDTPEDAREFGEAYRELLGRFDATRDGDVYTVPDSSTFGDAFRVTRDGTRVRIVNAPTVDALSAIDG